MVRQAFPQRLSEENAARSSPYFFSLKAGSYLTAALSSLPAENFGMRAAGIFKASPVRGLRPILAFRLEIVNVPKLTNVTRFPFFNDVVTAPVKASRATVAATLVIPALFAIFAINSSLVICFPPLVVGDLSMCGACWLSDPSEVLMETNWTGPS